MSEERSAHHWPCVTCYWFDQDEQRWHLAREHGEPAAEWMHEQVMEDWERHCKKAHSLSLMEVRGQMREQQL